MPYQPGAEAAPPDDGAVAELLAHRVQRIADPVLVRSGAAEEIALDEPRGVDQIVRADADEQTLVSAVLAGLRQLLPFDLLGFDTDNDSVFMNETVRDYSFR